VGGGLGGLLLAGLAVYIAKAKGYLTLGRVAPGTTSSDV
jgi:hypothetical protein